MTATSGFSVMRRNYGHWDISSGGRRLFRLRGGPGEWCVLDERPETRSSDRPINAVQFRDQAAAMAWICAELMHELLTVEGQKPYVMESWNVSEKAGGAA